MNGASFDTGIVGRAFSFEGSGEVVIPRDASLNLHVLTIEAWVYPTVTDGGIDVIVNKEVDSVFSLLEYEIGIRGTDFPGRGTIPVGNLAFYLGGINGLPGEHDGWADGGGAVPLNRWTHVALTFDGSTAVAYINGQMTRTLGNLSGSLTQSTGALKIGSRSDIAIARNPRERFTGLIDELTIYDHALSHSEIQAIFAAGSLGKCKPVDADGDGYPPPSDCDDQNPDIHPGAAEVCDARDNDCDGQVDNGVGSCCDTSSMVGWWSGEGDARDSVGSNHGALVGGASFAPGIVGQAFSFDGIDDYVNLFSEPSSFFSNSEAFTLEAWFRPESEASSYFILRNAAFGVRWQGSSHPMDFYNGTDHFSSKSSWQLGWWYHVALVDDGVNSVKLYIDGVLDKSDDGVLRSPNRFPCHFAGYCFELQFGGYYETHDVEYFKGQVDEVTLYRRALSASEIRDIFLAGSRGKCNAEDADGDGYSPPEDCDDQDPNIHPGATEICDGLDNDCNGARDDGIQPQPTSCGVGACAATGQTTCVNGIVSDTCTPGQPSVEACNGLDDDCDGTIDEELGVGAVSVSLDPVTLWPPNHRMVDVHATVVVVGGCPGACPVPVVNLASVTSNEPDDAPGLGDGHTESDIQDTVVGSADFDLRLRAERDSKGDGRLYRIAYTATDCFGDTATGYGGVFVPHDEGGTTEPLILDVVEQPTGGPGSYALEWEPIAGASAYNIVRGRMSSIRTVGSFTVIENAECLGRERTTTEFSGSTLEQDPPEGEAFFYLVEYFDGRYSGYGTAPGVGDVVVTSGDACH